MIWNLINSESLLIIDRIEIEIKIIIIRCLLVFIRSVKTRKFLILNEIPHEYIFGIQVIDY